jgi:hypothetical protein
MGILSVEEMEVELFGILHGLTTFSQIYVSNLALAKSCFFLECREERTRTRRFYSRGSPPIWNRERA